MWERFVCFCCDCLFALMRSLGLPWWFSDKESACSAGDLGSIPGSERSPGEGNGNPLQYSYLENYMAEEPDGLHGVAESQTRLSD